MAEGRAASPGSREPTRERVPAHLRHLVVEQAYEQYNAVDQAVWRFVLTQIYDTLRHTAHPAYESGLAETGISIDHIPRVEEMDRCLARYGWGAVCVDGFIPPRAFVEFQALGILPIAADMRSARHLVYTPAPDIIHEAAGHAPILPNAEYAAFLRRIGSVGAMAFSSKDDERVYRAIYALSEVKERPGATDAEIAATEKAFMEACEAVTRVTEATRMSRLYWWTAEYGLVGTPRDYRLFGAGLLSSLGESHSCHDASVKKIPLSAGCTEVTYDITRAQPQLFVARDFGHLGEVLGEVEATLAVARGGTAALEEARASEELATLRLCDRDDASAVQLIGIVASFAQSEQLCRVDLVGALGIAVQNKLCSSGRPETLPERAQLLVAHADPVWRSRPHHVGDEVTLELDGGARLRGRISLVVHDEGDHYPAERTLLLGLRDAHLGDTPLTGLVLFAGEKVASVRAGAADPTFYPPSRYSPLSVPGSRNFTETERTLIGLYDEAATLYRAVWGADAERIVSHLTSTLERNHPDEWLLRYHLLESLLRAGERPEAAEKLKADLERLEVRFARLEPIALGLRRLAQLTHASTAQPR